MVRLFFPGYIIDAGYVYGKNYMAAQATVIITIPGEPEFPWPAPVHLIRDSRPHR